MINAKFKQTGFTLLELLVALAVFALAGTAIMNSAGQHLNSIGVLEEMTFSQWVAANRQVELRLEGTFPPANNKRGQENMAERDWHWRQVTTETQDGNLRAVTIEIRHEANDQAVINELASFVSKAK